ncbi:MAG: response regulator, partial [Odoribacteraceae bacterium]|nr:response regulator [Odoribacteraceae bacterium]
LPVADFGFNSYVERVEEDPAGVLWIASQGKGLISFNPATGATAFYSNQQTGLPEMIGTLCITGEKIWIGTAGHGLYTYDLRRRVLARHPDPVFETHGNIFSILPGDNELWIVTGTGLLRHDTRDGSTRFYNEEEGLYCQPFTTNACVKTARGRVYIGGSNGFNTFIPGDIRDNTQPPRALVTALRLTGKGNGTGETLHPVARPDGEQEITLPRHHSGFTIEFIATSFRAPSKNAYKYTLVGFDKTWTLTDNRDNKATYTNLPPGLYTFRATSRAGAGAWNPDETRLHLTILPPWWATHLAYIAYALLFACLVLVAYRILVKRLERSHENKIETLRRENEKGMYEARLNLFTQVTHEIRTPLSLILAPVESILRHHGLPDEVREDLDVVKKNGERLLDLSSQLLDFTRLDREMYIITNTTFDLVELVEKTARRFVPAARQRGARLVTRLPGTPVPLFTDGEALTKILSNLLVNALKFTRDRVTVSADATDSAAILLTVEDNGRGIPEEERDKIFDLFYQGEHDRRLPATGFGIGLSIVRLLAGRINITVRVESRRGEYTRFTLHIPVIPGGDLPVTPPLPSPPPLPDAARKAGTVLIVEDDEEFIVYLARVFGRKYHACTAPDGLAALAIARENKIDLIISDIMMPVMDGIELCRRVKADIHLSHVPVVLLSARGDAAARAGASEAGADDYIEKPVSANSLHARVTNLLENRGKLREQFSAHPLIPLDTITGKADEKWFASVLESIRQNLSNANFSVDQLAREVNTSRTLLYTKVKAVTGLTPNDFIRLVRLKKAAELLKSNQHKINEISFMVGFNAPSYFAHCFQQQFGLLPREFIEQELNN